MANDGTVNVIISDGAISNIRTANAELQKTYDMMLDINEAGRKGVDNLQKLKAQEKQIKLQKTIIQLEQKLEAARQKGNSSTKKTADIYTKLNGRLIQYNKELKSLLLKQELKGKLDTKETQRVKNLEANIGRLSKAYTNVNQKLGQNQNVMGKTKRSFDSLGFSVAQLTRESPAFLISMNTGFMALSNNIPILVDEIQRAAVANKALTASGQKGVPVWKQLGKAVFGWQSLLSIGVVLLTLYGDKLVKMAMKAIKGKKAFDELAESQKNVNEVIKKGRDDAQGGIVDLIRLSKAVQDTTKSEKKRNEVLSTLRKKYSEDLQHLSDREILTNGIAKAEENLKQKILERATADAASQKISENMTKILELEEKRPALIQSAALAQSQLNEVQKNAQTITTQYGTTIDQTSFATDRANDTTEALVQNSRELNSLRKANNDLIEIAVKNIDSLITSTLTLSKEEEKYAINSEKWWGKKVSDLKKARDSVGRYSFDWVILNSALKDAQKTYEKLFGSMKKVNKELMKPQAGSIQAWKEELADVKDEMDKTTQFTPRWEELRVTFEFMTKVLEEMNKKTEEGKTKQEELIEAYEIGGEILQASLDIGTSILDRKLEDIDAEIEAHERKYERLQELAEGDVRQQQLLRNQEQKEREKLEAKRLKLEQKKARLAKAQALVDIAINTAVWVTRAGAEAGILGIPLIPVIVGIGALQAAAVLAQPIPQFAEGGTMERDGLAVVGDGGRQEVVRNPDGSIFLTPNRDTIVPLQKGAEIYKSIDTFANEMPNNSLNQASLLTSIRLNEMSIKSALLSEREFDKQLLDAMLGVKSAIKKQKLTSVNNSQRIDIADDLYKMKYNS